MTEGLSVEFHAVLENDVYQPGSRGTVEATGETANGPREEVASAPPMPDAGVGEGGRHDTHTAARERAMNSLMNLVDGTHEINDRILTFA